MRWIVCSVYTSVLNDVIYSHVVYLCGRCSVVNESLKTL